MSRGGWDVVVVGAGPAGSAAALGAARAGLRTLLLDRDPFPRWKVCGACLNAAALDVLEWAGLGDLPARAGAPVLRELDVRGWGREARIPLRRSVALSRRALDAALVEAARDAGAVHWTARAAACGPVRDGRRELRLQGKSIPETVEARTVVLATGLTPLPVEGGGMAGTGIRIQPGARVGVGAVLPAAVPGFASGRIHMVTGPAGYVGLVRQEDGSLDVAGALDPDFIRGAGSVEAAVRKHLEEQGSPLPPGAPLEGWKGTPPLTRSATTVAEERLFRVGDAAGYVEPFTGEGMAWALAGARLLVPLLVPAAREWTPSLGEEWERRYRRGVARRQRTCRSIAWISRRSTATRGALAAAAIFPGWAKRVARRTARPIPAPPSGVPAP